MFTLFCKILFKLNGWKIVGKNVPMDLTKYVLIAAPHTSNWDFPYGIAARSYMGLKTNFIGKAPLFKPPLGWFMRRLGGFPVDRTKRNNFVDQVVQLFHENDPFSVTMSPEGTRKKVKAWKSGFYHIAHQAGVPIAMIGFDYPTREIRYLGLYHPTGDYEREIHEIRSHFEGIRGKNY